MIVTVQVADTASSQVEITAKMSLGEWRLIVARISDAQSLAFYEPLSELHRAIRDGLAAIERREEIRPKNEDPSK